MHDVRLGPLTARVSHWPLRINLPSLVLLHGAGFTAGFWQPQWVLQNRVNLIFLNLPGRCGADNAEPHVQEYLQVIEAALQEIPAYFVMGHSLGGGLALGHCLATAHQVQGLIMVNSGARLKVAPAVTAMLQGAAQNPLGQMLSAGSTLPVQDIAHISAAAGSVQNALADFAVCNEIDFMPQLPSLKLPVLIVGCDNDPLTPFKYSQFMADNITASRLLLVEGGGHLLPWARPEQLNQAVLDFIFPA